MQSRLLAILLCGWAALASAAYEPQSSRGIDLSGTWKLNVALSDDAERLLSERLAKERKREEQWRRQQELMRPREGIESMDDPAAQAPRPGQSQRPWQKRREESFRKMVAISDTLTVRQAGRAVQIVSQVDSRRFEAGSRTQVSMPDGQLADSNVGWEGQWFVIERRVSNGPRVVEKYRLLPKTGQLEYLMSWGGQSELSGLKVRRVFDRIAAGAPAPDPALGPIR